MSAVSVTVDLSVHPKDVVLRACHAFTARYSIALRHSGTDVITVELTPLGEEKVPPGLAGEFSNALLDHHLRALVSAETATIRELLVAQAFCEADLLDRRDGESDEHADPRRIAR
jgi:His-Xaa-Ser system protein HxsD